jgi:hypothetical protein
LNIDTGHLVTEKTLDRLLEERRRDYQKVPPSLAGDAERALSGRSETHVNLREPSRLSAWAKRRRKERRKAEKHARKAQRRV